MSATARLGCGALHGTTGIASPPAARIVPGVTSPDSDRRPLSTRDARWAQALAAALARRRVRPNAISVASVLVAALGALALAFAPECAQAWQRAALYVACAAAIQLRLVCNLIDGLVAVEGGLRTKTGDVFNDLPDRVADLLLLAGAGYAARELPHAIELGWLAAALALLAAYVRVLGKSVGAGTHFLGPMAKQHRMAALTATCLLAALLTSRALDRHTLVVGLGVIVLGTLITVVRRTQRVLNILTSA